MSAVWLNAFALSFCSLGYQITLALALSDATGDYVFSQTAGLGIFLLGMGVGAWRSSGVDSQPWRKLLTVEWTLALLGLFAVSWVYCAESLLKFLGFLQPTWIYAATFPYIFAIGVLTGFELPLLFKAAPFMRKGQLFAANYLGAFAATIAVPVWVIPKLDVTGTAHALGTTNFLIASMILPRAFPALRALLLHLVLGIAVLAVTHFSPKLEAIHLKTVYFSPHLSTHASLAGSWNLLNSLDLPLRLRTAYQWIDLLPPEFSSDVQGQQDFQLYLDRKLQLSSGTSARYHESMVHGGANLLGRDPQRVLILGGGDGLLAAELLKYPSVQAIDLVEIDAEMIRLARTQKDLKQMNRGALTDARVAIHEQDAFQFVRETHDKFDLVLVDLPFPVNYDLSLLFTKEFYGLIKQRLLDDGVLLLDFPLPGGDQRHLPHLVHTLRAARFENLFAFGTEDFFVAASSRALAFEPASLVPKVQNQTLTNLISRNADLEAAERIPARVNSVLFPIRFGAYE